jgi:uncharacterized protein YbaP (TraB family)
MYSMCDDCGRQGRRTGIAARRAQPPGSNDWRLCCKPTKRKTKGQSLNGGKYFEKKFLRKAKKQNKPVRTWRFLDMAKGKLRRRSFHCM